MGGGKLATVRLSFRTDVALWTVRFVCEVRFNELGVAEFLVDAAKTISNQK